MFSDSVAPSPASLSPLGRKNSIESGMNLSSDLLVSPESSTIELQLPEPEVNRPHHSHFAKKSGSSTPSSASSASTPKLKTDDDVKKPDTKTDDKKLKIPKLPIAGLKNNNNNNGSPSSSPAPSSPGRNNVPSFLTKIGNGIAHFIRENYFGKRSLAQRDTRHAALLGCSQVPDYLTLRDNDNVTYSPIMYDNLVTAVTKKFTSEVLPQFLNSVPFQVMVRSLIVCGYFSKKDNKDNKPEQVSKEAGDNKDEDGDIRPDFDTDELLKGMWQIAKGGKKKSAKKSDDDNSSDSSSSSSDDEDEDGDNDDDDKMEEEKSKKDDKKEQPKVIQPESEKPEVKKEENDDDDDDENSSSSSSSSSSSDNNSDDSSDSE